MREFSHAGLVFDVDDAGPPDGEVLVLLHGYPENRTAWHAVTPLLIEAGFRVLAPDQRGYSPGARPRGRGGYRLEHLADDIVALVEAAGAERVHVVGHDWGGAVAWALAERHPDRLSSMTSLATPHPRAMRRAMVTGDQALRSWYMFALQVPALPELAFRPRMTARLRKALVGSGLPADAADRYVEPLQQPGAATAAINWYRAMPLSRPLRGGVTVPTLYVYASGDRFLGRKAADLTERYVAAPYRYEVLDGVSHWVQECVPGTVASLVIAHVRQHPASARHAAPSAGPSRRRRAPAP